MELTINIKEQNKVAFLIHLLQEFDYVEIIDVKENESDIPEEHKKLLEKRLKRIENGETSFKSWDLIKDKYAKKAV